MNGRRARSDTEPLKRSSSTRPHCRFTIQCIRLTSAPLAGTADADYIDWLRYRMDKLDRSGSCKVKSDKAVKIEATPKEAVSDVIRPVKIVRSGTSEQGD